MTDNILKISQGNEKIYHVYMFIRQEVNEAP